VTAASASRPHRNRLSPFQEHGLSGLAGAHHGLYLVEKQARKLTPEKRFEYRQRHTKPVLDAIRAWLGQVLPQVLPTSATGKALHYLHNEWHMLP